MSRQFQFTTIMYAIPSFIEGIARVLDFAGTMTEYNTSRSPSDADRRALAADVMAIMADAALVAGGGAVGSQTKIA